MIGIEEIKISAGYPIYFIFKFYTNPHDKFMIIKNTETDTLNYL